MLVQGNDFKHLYETRNCVLEIGGNDQWSNIISGVDLVRKTSQGKVFAIAVKLITNTKEIRPKANLIASVIKKLIIF